MYLVWFCSVWFFSVCLIWFDSVWFSLKWLKNTNCHLTKRLPLFQKTKYKIYNYSKYNLLSYQTASSLSRYKRQNTKYNISKYNPSSYQTASSLCMQRRNGREVSLAKYLHHGKAVYTFIISVGFLAIIAIIFTRPSPAFGWALEDRLKHG